MIVIGYQGIGKSTLAKKDIRCIDLESGNFWISEKRHDDWYIPYCKIAVDLSSQGYVVFLSSHEVVRKCLSHIRNGIFVCYPELYLKDEWISRLEERYQKSKLDKDYKAWQNALDRYAENITEIINSGFMEIPITSMDYSLEQLIFGRES